jgi:hypothetical protein
MPFRYRTTHILAIIPVLLLFFQPCANAAYTLEQKDKFIKEIYAKTIPAHRKTWSKVRERPVKDFLIEQGIEFCDSFKGTMTVEKSQELQRGMDAISQKYSQEPELHLSVDKIIDNAALKHFCPNANTTQADNPKQQTGQGNLTKEEARLLGKNSNTPIKGSTENVKIVVTNALHYVDNYIIGSVTNVGNKKAVFVTVNFAVFDAAGTMVDIGSTGTIPSILEPGETGILKTSTLKKGQTVRTTSVEWMKTGANP